MSKYIDSEKLIKLVKEWRSKQMGFAWDAVSEVLKIIASLQQEQPEVDLEKELKNERIALLDAFGPMNGVQSLAIRNLARHFFELGRLNTRKEE